MLIFAADTDSEQLGRLHAAIADAEPQADLLTFQSADALLASIAVHGLVPDAVFTDFALGNTNGLHLGDQIRRRCPDAKIIFVTADAAHALEAYQHHINGYLLKPVTAAAIRRELDAQFAQQLSGEKLQVQCFGHFEVFYHSNPVLFRRRQTKELFAFLVDRCGRACSSEEIAAALWEDEGEMPLLKQRVRNLLSDLRVTLREIGMERVLIREHRLVAVRRGLLDCDYYQLRSGEGQPLLREAYMPEYSWAEATDAELESSHL